jgi:hypothetical protein
MRQPGDGMSLVNEPKWTRGDVTNMSGVSVRGGTLRRTV